MSNESAYREWHTRALDSEIRAAVLRRDADQSVDLDHVVRSLDLSLHYSERRYVARVRRPRDVFDCVGYGSTTDEAIRAAMRSLALQHDRDARRARRMSSELLGELVTTEATS